MTERQPFSGRLIAAQESERRRLARELHDNLGQKLALLCMEIDSLGAHTGVVPAALAEAITSLSERARDISSDVHCLSHDPSTTATTATNSKSNVRPARDT
jgi:signal transduction histidine kinase